MNTSVFYFSIELVANRDNYEMCIRIFCFFLNRSIIILIDCCSKWQPSKSKDGPHHHQVMLIMWIPLTLYLTTVLITCHIWQVLKIGIKCPHTADECETLLVVQHWCVHEWELTGELCLWVGPCFFSSAQHAIHLTWTVC